MAEKKKKKHRFLKFILIFLLVSSILVSLIFLGGKIAYDKLAKDKLGISYGEALSLVVNINKQGYLKNEEFKPIEKNNEKLISSINKATESVAFKTSISENNIQEVIKLLLVDSKQEEAQNKIYEILSTAEVDPKAYPVQDSPIFELGSEELSTLSSIILKEYLKEKLSKQLKVDLDNKIEVVYFKYLNTDNEKAHLKADVRIETSLLVGEILKQNKIPEFLGKLLPKKTDIILTLFLEKNLDPIVSINNFASNQKLDKALNTLLDNLKNLSQSLDIRKTLKSVQTEIQNKLAGSNVKMEYAENKIKVYTLDTIINILMKEKTEEEKQNFKTSFIYFANKAKEENNETKVFVSDQQKLTTLNKKLNNVFLQNVENENILQSVLQDNGIDNIKNNINIKKYINEEKLNLSTDITKEELKEAIYFVFNSVNNENLTQVKKYIILSNIESKYENNEGSLVLLFAFNPKEEIKNKINEQTNLNASLKEFIIKYATSLINAINLKIEIKFNNGLNFEKNGDSYIKNIDISFVNATFEETMNKINSLLSSFTSNTINIDQNEIKNVLKNTINNLLKLMIENSKMNKEGENTFININEDPSIALTIAPTSLNLRNLFKVYDVSKESFTTFLVKLYSEQTQLSNVGNYTSDDFNNFKNSIKEKYYLKETSQISTAEAKNIFSVFNKFQDEIEADNYFSSSLADETQLVINNQLVSYIFEEILKDKFATKDFFSEIKSYIMVINDDKTINYIFRMKPNFSSIDASISANIPNLYVSFKVSLNDSTISEININGLEDNTILQKIIDNNTSSSINIENEVNNISFSFNLDLESLTFNEGEIRLETISSLIVNSIVKKGNAKSISFTEEEKTELKEMLRNVIVESVDINNDKIPEATIVAAKLNSGSEPLVSNVLINNEDLVEAIFIKTFEFTISDKTYSTKIKMYFKMNDENKPDKEQIKVNTFDRQQTKIMYKLVQVYGDDNRSLEEILIEKFN